jgi:hypothetical protein
MNFMNNMSGMITTIVAVPFVLVALGLAYMAFRSSRKAGISKSWPTTMGQIVSASVEARRSRSGSSGYSTSHYPQVIYEYTVNGQKYMGNHINFGSPIGYGFAGMAERIIVKYPIGGMVQVYYNPADPSQAVLERSGGASSKILLGVAALIIVILAVTVAFTAGIGNMVSGITSSLPK